MTRKQLATGLGLLAAAGLLAGATIWLNRTGATEEPAGTTDSPPTLDQAIAAASDYLVRHCDETGRFAYRVNLAPNVDVGAKYNIIRHAGTVYALAASHRRQPSKEKLAALRRATRFLRANTMGPIPGHPDMLTIWSHPEIEGTRRELSAKLGGAGLGLVAFLSVEDVAPGTTPIEELRALGRFILFMQKPDGGFYAKFYPDRRGRDPRSRSLYYPGEAALGLVMLYEKDPQPMWLDGAARALAYLARTRRGAPKVEADHWALLATARLWPLCDRCAPPLPRETLSHHARQICREILDTPKETPGPATALGCLTADGRTCPTATRVEGLTAVLTFLPKSDEGLRAEIAEAAEGAVEFLLANQVREGSYAGGIPGATQPDESADHDQRATSRQTEIRIDYVQHMLSAMIQWQGLQNEETVQDHGEKVALRP